MGKRRATGSRPKTARDPYRRLLELAWPTILRAYRGFKADKPIIEYRIPEMIVCSYPPMPYIDDLTERTREQTRRIYVRAAASRKFMVFVRDSTKRVLRSYVFPLEELDEE